MNTIFVVLVVHTVSTNLEWDFQVYLTMLQTEKIKFLGSTCIFYSTDISKMLSPIHNPRSACTLDQKVPASVSMSHTSHPVSSCYAFGFPLPDICTPNPPATPICETFLTYRLEGKKKERCPLFCLYRITLHVKVWHKIYSTVAQCLKRASSFPKLLIWDCSQPLKAEQIIFKE